ncbi:MAG: arginine--tRNA ligase, partial [Clostridia bacterium]|nr:arginine--tRNA ligase [Clostridia bacterium]
MNYKQYIAKKINIEGVSTDQVEGFIEVPPSTEVGDYALPCFRFAKILRASPVAIAERLKNEFSTDEIITSV